MVRTYEEVGRYFSRTKRSIQNWANKGMPVVHEGLYDLHAIEDWAFNAELIQERPSGRGEETTAGTKAHYETEIRRLQAELKQLELDRKRGESIGIQEHERRIVAQIETVKRALLGVGRTLAPVLVGLEAREIQAMIDDRMREIIAAFAMGLKP
jgi:phage terminase Nu1 subunit (DNA packaging protein)